MVLEHAPDFANAAGPEYYAVSGPIGSRYLMMTRMNRNEQASGYCSYSTITERSISCRQTSKLRPSPFPCCQPTLSLPQSNAQPFPHCASGSPTSQFHAQGHPVTVSRHFCTFISFYQARYHQTHSSIFAPNALVRLHSPIVALVVRITSDTRQRRWFVIYGRERWWVGDGLVEGRCCCEGIGDKEREDGKKESR